jgi:hypothetical protein
MLQTFRSLGEEPTVPESEVVQLSRASTWPLQDPEQDRSRIVALDEISRLLGRRVQLILERHPPLILVH